MYKFTTFALPLVSQQGPAAHPLYASTITKVMHPPSLSSHLVNILLKQLSRKLLFGEDLEKFPLPQDLKRRMRYPPLEATPALPSLPSLLVHTYRPRCFFPPFLFPHSTQKMAPARLSVFIGFIQAFFLTSWIIVMVVSIIRLFSVSLRCAKD